MKPVMLDCGTCIRGRWYGKKFETLKHIANGGTASIYLVKDMATGIKYAMKISDCMVNLEEEYRVLSRLDKFKYVPSVFYRDDCVLPDGTYYFLVADYYDGSNLFDLCKNRPVHIKTAVQIVLIACSICCELNKMNIYYCDMKPENLVFDKAHGLLYLIDFGGTAGQGESIPHFTPYFDRASWGKGSRIADEGYQIFGLTMLLIVLAITGRPDGRKDYTKLLGTIENSNLSKGLKRFIIKGLEQKYDSLSGYRQSLLNIMADAVYEESHDTGTGLLIDIALAISVVLFIFTVVLVT